MDVGQVIVALEAQGEYRPQWEEQDEQCAQQDITGTKEECASEEAVALEIATSTEQSVAPKRLGGPVPHIEVSARPVARLEELAMGVACTV